MERVTLAFLAFILWAAPVRAAEKKKPVPVEYSAVVNDTPVKGVNVDHLRKETNELKGVVDGKHADDEIHARAMRLFERVNDEDSSNVVTPQLEGWGKPDPYTPDADRDEGGVDGMLNRMGKEIGKNRKADEKAAPGEVVEAYKYGKWMRNLGLMNYTDELSDNVLGVYVYKKNAPIGIFFNQQFFQLQALLGDAFAAATAIHESAHSRDHAQGKLNPKEVIKGEKLAYQSEYWWLKTIDPKGQKLSWARATLCADYDTPGTNQVCDFLEHLAKIQRYGSAGDFDGLVLALGYRDRTDDPFAERAGGNAENIGGHHGHSHESPYSGFTTHFPGDGHDHPIESHYLGDGHPEHSAGFASGAGR